MSKIFKTRDSATAALRKLGVDSTDYTLYVEKHKDGFECFIEDAAAAVGVELPKGKEANKPEKQVKIAKAPKAAPVKTIKATAAVKPLSIAGSPETTTFAERVHAHDQLESIGVKPEHTTQFIEKTKQGFMALNHKAIEWVLNGHKKAPVKTRSAMQVSIDKATAAHMKGSTKQDLLSNIEEAVAPKAPKPVKRVPVHSTQQARSVAGGSVASFMRKLIVEGLSDDEVMSEAIKQFKMGAVEAQSKEKYPAWYRRDCVARGLIAPL